jgi:hypothetical protein
LTMSLPSCTYQCAALSFVFARHSSAAMNLAIKMNQFAASTPLAPLDSPQTDEF